MACRVLGKGITRITYEYGRCGHTGVDLGHKVIHEDILAHTAGTVVSAVSGHRNDTKSSGTASYGNYVKIDHGRGYCTLYAHLNTVNVRVGQTVVKGQKIGTMGNTGNSYGEHLHFEVRFNNKTTNPTPYIEKDLPGFTVAAAKKSVADIAAEVLAGKWGNGADRKNRLTAAGYDYQEVQNAVRAKLSGKAAAPTKSVTVIAKEVIAGKWGNGLVRMAKLKAAGYNYTAVQNEVKRLLK